MSKPAAYRHQLRALLRWPKDPLRPDIQFQDVIRRRIDRRMGLVKADDKQKSPVQKEAPIWDETAELEQANALYSLAENRYSRQYPLTRILNPASNPTHYKDLIRELEEAPSRTLLGRFVNRWKGFLRFK